jgi:hypothetical protein
LLFERRLLLSLLHFLLHRFHLLWGFEEFLDDFLRHVFLRRIRGLQRRIVLRHGSGSKEE